jgi:uncharacterized protein (TIGR03435 family)
MQKFDGVSGTRKLMSAAALLALALPFVLGFAHSTPSLAQSQSQSSGAGPVKFEYEVASFKPVKSSSGPGMFKVGIAMTPDGLTASNVTLGLLIQQAYGVQNYQIQGAPDWLNSERFDVDAKMDGAVADELKNLSPDDRTAARQQMLRALLEDRLHLTVDRNTKDMPVYFLVVGKNGPKLQESKPDPAVTTAPDASSGGGGGVTRNFSKSFGGGMQTFSASGAPIANLVRILSAMAGRPVLDRTGLTGNYDYKLEFSSEQGPSPVSSGGDGSGKGPESAPALESSGPSLFTALQEQLGLKLESGKGPVETIVIAHVERPSEN